MPGRPTQAWFEAPWLEEDGPRAPDATPASPQADGDAWFPAPWNDDDDSGAPLDPVVSADPLIWNEYGERRQPDRGAVLLGDPAARERKRLFVQGRQFWNRFVLALLVLQSVLGVGLAIWKYWLQPDFIVVVESDRPPVALIWSLDLSSPQGDIAQKIISGSEIIHTSLKTELARWHAGELKDSLEFDNSQCEFHGVKGCFGSSVCLNGRCISSHRQEFTGGEYISGIIASSVKIDLETYDLKSDTALLMPPTPDTSRFYEVIKKHPRLQVDPDQPQTVFQGASDPLGALKLCRDVMLGNATGAGTYTVPSDAHKICALITNGMMETKDKLALPGFVQNELDPHNISVLMGFLSPNDGLFLKRKGMTEIVRHATKCDIGDATNDTARQACEYYFKARSIKEVEESAAIISQKLAATLSDRADANTTKDARYLWLMLTPLMLVAYILWGKIVTAIANFEVQRKWRGGAENKKKMIKVVQRRVEKMVEESSDDEELELADMSIAKASQSESTAPVESTGVQDTGGEGSSGSVQSSGNAVSTTEAPSGSAATVTKKRRKKKAAVVEESPAAPDPDDVARTSPEGCPEPDQPPKPAMPKPKPMLGGMAGILAQLKQGGAPKLRAVENSKLKQEQEDARRRLEEGSSSEDEEELQTRKAAQAASQDGKFKHKVVANTAYMWSRGGGGAAVMKVDYGKGLIAPPSAMKKDHAGPADASLSKKTKRRKEQTEFEGVGRVSVKEISYIDYDNLKKFEVATGRISVMQDSEVVVERDPPKAPPPKPKPKAMGLASALAAAASAKAAARQPASPSSSEYETDSDGEEVAPTPVKADEGVEVEVTVSHVVQVEVEEQVSVVRKKKKKKAVPSLAPEQEMSAAAKAMAAQDPQLQAVPTGRILLDDEDGGVVEYILEEVEVDKDEDLEQRAALEMLAQGSDGNFTSLSQHLYTFFWICFGLTSFVIFGDLLSHLFGAPELVSVAEPERVLESLKCSIHDTHDSCLSFDARCEVEYLNDFNCSELQCVEKGTAQQSRCSVQDQIQMVQMLEPPEDFPSEESRVQHHSHPLRRLSEDVVWKRHEKALSLGFAQGDREQRTLAEAKDACLINAECLAVTCIRGKLASCTLRKGTALVAIGGTDTYTLSNRRSQVLRGRLRLVSEHELQDSGRRTIAEAMVGRALQNAVQLEAQWKVSLFPELTHAFRSIEYVFPVTDFYFGLSRDGGTFPDALASLKKVYISGWIQDEVTYNLALASMYPAQAMAVAMRMDDLVHLRYFLDCPPERDIRDCETGVIEDESHGSAGLKIPNCPATTDGWPECRCQTGFSAVAAMAVAPPEGVLPARWTWKCPDAPGCDPCRQDMQFCPLTPVVKGQEIPAGPLRASHKVVCLPGHSALASSVDCEQGDDGEGRWTTEGGVQLVCEADFGCKLEHPENAELLDPVPLGERGRFACTKGYARVGTQEPLCEYVSEGVGLWNLFDNQCQQIPDYCRGMEISFGSAVPPSPVNFRVEHSDVVCEPGYHCPGECGRFCLVDTATHGTWSPHEVPECVAQPAFCGQLRIARGGMYIPPGILGEQHPVLCAGGYTATVKRITCAQEAGVGIWTPAPDCELLADYCSGVQVSHGKDVPASSVGDIVSLECDAGYTVVQHTESCHTGSPTDLGGTAPAGVPCEFGVDYRDAGHHCIENSTIGPFGWCFVRGFCSGESDEECSRLRFERDCEATAGCTWNAGIWDDSKTNLQRHWGICDEVCGTPVDARREERKEMELGRAVRCEFQSVLAGKWNMRPACAPVPCPPGSELRDGRGLRCVEMSDSCTCRCETGYSGWLQWGSESWEGACTVNPHYCTGLMIDHGPMLHSAALGTVIDMVNCSVGYQYLDGRPVECIADQPEHGVWSHTPECTRIEDFCFSTCLLNRTNMSACLNARDAEIASAGIYDERAILCPPGFDSIDFQTVCESDRTWQPPPACELDMHYCEPFHVFGGQEIPAAPLRHVVTNVTCDPGKRLASPVPPVHIECGPVDGAEPGAGGEHGVWRSRPGGPLSAHGVVCEPIPDFCSGRSVENGKDILAAADEVETHIHCNLGFQYEHPEDDAVVCRAMERYVGGEVVHVGHWTSHLGNALGHCELMPHYCRELRLDHAIADVEAGPLGVIRHIECEVGFRYEGPAQAGADSHSGPNNLKCQLGDSVSGRWSDSEPRCEAVPEWCSETCVATAANLRECLGTTVSAGIVDREALVTCPPGHVPDSDIVRCDQSRSWSPPPACHLKPEYCTGIVVVHGEDVAAQTLGALTTVTCELGRILPFQEQSDVVECKAGTAEHGTWLRTSGLVLEQIVECAIKSDFCGSIQIVNGALVPEGAMRAVTTVVCDDAYELQDPGSGELACSALEQDGVPQNAGRWTSTAGTIPSCSMIVDYCAELDVENGELIPSGKLSDVAPVRCLHGFSYPDAEVVCGHKGQQEGQWSDSPKCTPVACPPNALNHPDCRCATGFSGSITWVNSGWVGKCSLVPDFCASFSVEHGTTVPAGSLQAKFDKLSCRSGFTLPQAAVVLSCQDDGGVGGWMWNNEPANNIACSLVESYCGSVTFTHGSQPLQPGRLGESLDWSCRVGHRPAHISAYSTCTELDQLNGKWTPGPACEQIPDYCRSLPVINGQEIPSGVLGLRTEIYCKEGFGFEGGSLVCREESQEQGAWEDSEGSRQLPESVVGMELECIRSDCPENAAHDKRNLCVCKLGYHADPPLAHAGSQWFGSCKKLPEYCAPLDVSNGLRLASSSGAGVPLQTAFDTASCKPGYEYEGEEIVCTTGDARSGLWIPDKVHCTLIEAFCTETNVMHGETVPAGSLDEQARVLCEPGYEYAQHLICTSEGRWSDSSPTCIPINGYCQGIAVQNGQALPSGEVGRTASVQCSRGFAYSGGELECIAESAEFGRWGDAYPACNTVPCPQNGEGPECKCRVGFQGQVQWVPESGSWDGECISIADYCPGSSVERGRPLEAMSIGSSTSYKRGCDLGFRSSVANVECLKDLQTRGKLSAIPICSQIPNFCGELEVGNVEIPAGYFGVIVPVTCSLGKQPAQEKVRCQENQKWDAQFPLCENIAGYCPGSDVENGAAVPASSVDTTVSIDCYDGFSWVGPKPRCLADQESVGSWSVKLSCQKTTGYCSSVEATSQNQLGRDVPAGSIGDFVQIECRAGFRQASTQSGILCEAAGPTGRWSEDPECEMMEAYCPPVDIDNGGQMPSGSVESVGVATCHIGYELDGPLPVCTAYRWELGQWDRDTKCIEIQDFCGSFDLHGYEVPGSPLGTTVPVPCPLGHRHFGSREITCSPDQWNVEAPFCEPVMDYCPESRVVSGEDIQASEFGRTAAVTCWLGYRFNGEQPRCVANPENNGTGAWDSVLECSKLPSYCPAVEPSESNHLRERINAVALDDVVLVRCRFGYVGPGEVSCVALSAAVGELSTAPTCMAKVNYCPPFTVKLGNAEIQHVDGAMVGGTSTIECMAGYAYRQRKVECRPGTEILGEWSDTAPVCVPVEPPAHTQCDEFASCRCMVGFSGEVGWHVASQSWEGTCVEIADYCPEVPGINVKGTPVPAAALDTEIAVTAVQCENGKPYEATGDVFRCTEGSHDHGQWEIAGEELLEVQCGPVEICKVTAIPNGRALPAGFKGDTSQLECHEGADPNTDFVICDENAGGWVAQGSGDKPSCSGKECAVPTVQPNMVMTPSQGPFGFGMVVNYLCMQASDRMNGPSTRTCDAEGQWYNDDHGYDEPTCSAPVQTMITVLDGTNKRAVSAALVNLAGKDTETDKRGRVFGDGFEDRPMAVKVTKLGFVDAVVSIDVTKCDESSRGGEKEYRCEIFISPLTKGDFVCTCSGCITSADLWEVRAILSWAANPEDLDAWARPWPAWESNEPMPKTVGTMSYTRGHIHWSKLNVNGRSEAPGSETRQTKLLGKLHGWVGYIGQEATFVKDDGSHMKLKLDVDVQRGKGPETTTFTNLAVGKYHYVVHRFSGSPTSIAESKAQVSIYVGATQIVCTVDDKCSSGSDLWAVFEMEVSEARQADGVLAKSVRVRAWPEDNSEGMTRVDGLPEMRAGQAEFEEKQPTSCGSWKCNPCKNVFRPECRGYASNDDDLHDKMCKGTCRMRKAGCKTSGLEFGDPYLGKDWISLV